MKKRPRKSPKASLLKQYSRNRYLVLLTIPGILYYIIFCYGPMYGIQLAFKDYLIGQSFRNSPWAGLHYFRTLFQYPSFMEVFSNTLVLSLLKLMIGFPAPIIFAILLNEVSRKHFKKTVQTISYLPHFVSWVVLGALFKQFLSPSMGPLNIALKSIGLNPIFFMGDPQWFRVTLVLTSVWKSIGWGSIIYLAALSGIEPQLYEAAEIDGANRFQKIRRITLPSLTPVITIMLIFALRGIVNDDFDQIFNMYNPAVYQTGDVLSTYIYRVGLEQFEYSLSTAVNLFKNLLAFLFIVLGNYTAKRINDYGIW